MEAALRAIVRHGEVVRISTQASTERVLFRHDRVRDALLADAIAGKLELGSFDDEALGEPFFAEHLGSALRHDGVPQIAIAIARDRNPLALFSALREFGERNTPFKTAIVAAIREWLESEYGRGRKSASMRPMTWLIWLSYQGAVTPGPTRCGIRTNGRPGLSITRRDQMIAIGPYAEHFDGIATHTLWQWCNEKGWHDLRRRFFDSYSHVDRKYTRSYLDKDAIAAELDQLTQPNRLNWIGTELEAWMQTGANVDHIMAFIDGWRKESPTIERFQVAAAAVGHAGMRRHLSLLNHDSEPSGMSEEIRLDAAFRVSRRTLR